MTDAQDTVTHALPTPGAGERMAHIPVLSIARSLTNPCKHFDPEKLSELADSIKASGVHQPILVRPSPWNASAMKWLGPGPRNASLPSTSWSVASLVGAPAR